MNKKSLQGFTLIELLIVIVIIGILSTLALPQYRLATEKSKIEAVLPIMRKIREAQMLYFMEYREPTCDLQKLNLKLDVVTEHNLAYGTSSDGDRKRDKNGKIISNPDDIKGVKSCGYDNVSGPGWEEGKPWYGNIWVLTLASKDTMILIGNKIVFGDASNNITIDYHLLGTIDGEQSGAWHYTGCFAGYNRCDGVCVAPPNSVWEKVCQSLANGRTATKGGSTENGIPYCIGGGKPQESPCRSGQTFEAW